MLQRSEMPATLGLRKGVRKMRTQGYLQRFRICVLLTRRGRMSSTELAMLLGIGKVAVLGHLETLMKEGRVDFTGDTRRPKYGRVVLASELGEE